MIADNKWHTLICRTKIVLGKSVLNAYAFALLAGALTPAASAQTPQTAKLDAGLLDAGEALYVERCEQCHQAAGEGLPPTFPALAGNPQLQDVDHIVQTVRSGRGAMPPHPEFGAEELAALATYIRNSWGNRFGGAPVASVEAALERLPRQQAAAEPDSTGWYTEEQAFRGAGHYTEHCAECHGADFVPDEFATGLTGAAFEYYWEGRTVYDFFETIRTLMPYGNEGSLASSTYIDIVAYLLEANGFPPGDEELPAEREVLSGLRIGS